MNHYPSDLSLPGSSDDIGVSHQRLAEIPLLLNSRAGDQVGTEELSQGSLLSLILLSPSSSPSTKGRLGTRTPAVAGALAVVVLEMD